MNKGRYIPLPATPKGVTSRIPTRQVGVLSQDEAIKQTQRVALECARAIASGKNPKLVGR
jgi:hypothetical protein